MATFISMAPNCGHVLSVAIQEHGIGGHQHPSLHLTLATLISISQVHASMTTGKRICRTVAKREILILLV